MNYRLLSTLKPMLNIQQLQLALQKQKFKRRTLRLFNSSQYKQKKNVMGDVNMFFREFGVAIGGVGSGSWEGGEMMARWVYKNHDQIQNYFAQFQTPTALELGSGIGITGFVMGLALKTVLTDYKTSILENLQYNLWVNTETDGKGDIFDTETQFLTFQDIAKRLKENVHISYIDWYNPGLREPLLDKYEDIQLLPPYIQKLALYDISNQKFKLIYGSELNYCMETVIPLANTIDMFLDEGGVFWEIISIYRGQGVKAFMDEMKHRGYTVECRPLPDEFYVNIESCQRKRDEKYMMWTLYKGQNGPLMTFGNGELVDWETFEYRRDL